MRIVLRNRGRGRVDAVYVLDAVGFGNGTSTSASEYWLTAHWGKWEKFQPADLDGLQKQEKYHGDCKGTLMAKVQKFVSAKMRNGYQVQEEFSRLPEWPILPHGQNWREWEL